MDEKGIIDVGKSGHSAMESKPVEKQKKLPPKIQKSSNPVAGSSIKKNPAPAQTQPLENWNVKPSPNVRVSAVPVVENVPVPINPPAVQSSSKELKATDKKVILPKPEVKEAEPVDLNQSAGKTREQIKAEREAKKLEKLAKKSKDSPAEKPKAIVTIRPVQDKAVQDLTIKTDKLNITEETSSHKPAETPGKPKATKEERRALQEAQRKAKEEKMTPLKKIADKDLKTPAKQNATFVPPTPKTPKVTAASSLHKVKLFKHLYTDSCSLDINLNGIIHPAIVKIGVQFAQNQVVGCNSRCLAFLKALKSVSLLILCSH